MNSGLERADVLEELMYRSSLGSGFLLPGFTGNFAVENEFRRKCLGRKSPNLRDSRDECAVSFLVAAWSCARLLTTQLN